MDKVLHHVAWSIEARLTHVWRVGGEVAGAHVLQEDTPWFSSEPALYDLMFYVKPQARKSRAAASLIDAAKALAEARKRPLFICVTSGVDIARKDLFMRRRGFQPRGGFYSWGA
jgi:hypothetical protein